MVGVGKALKCVKYWQNLGQMGGPLVDGRKSTQNEVRGARSGLGTSVGC